MMRVQKVQLVFSDSRLSKHMYLIEFFARYAIVDLALLQKKVITQNEFLLMRAKESAYMKKDD